MTFKKEINDSKDSKRGDFYQILVALKYAFSDELRNFKLLTFEHFGDVSFDNDRQIECKHHKNKSSLADTSEDFWKTLYNWSIQKETFEKLELYTTEHFPMDKKKPSKLRKWNKATMEQRWEILKDIQFRYKLDEIINFKIFDKNLLLISNLGISQKTIELLGKNKDKVLTPSSFNKLIENLNIDESEKHILITELKDTSNKKFNAWNFSRIILSNNEPIYSILGKIIIKAKQPIDDELMEELQTYPIFKDIGRSSNEIKEIILSIAGIINSKVAGNNRFELTNEQLYNIIRDKKKDYFNSSYRPIFDQLHKQQAPDNISKTFEQHKFVNELNTIHCDNDEIDEAVVDYWKTITLLDIEETNSPGFIDDEYSFFKSDVHIAVKTKKRDFIKKSDLELNLDESLRFYRKARQLPIGSRKSIINYPYIVHGTMQKIVEDNEQNFSWIL